MSSFAVYLSSITSGPKNIQKQIQNDYCKKMGFGLVRNKRVSIASVLIILRPV